FILDSDERFYCLELNSVPGMTDLSLVPMAAAADGTDFKQLLTAVIESGVKRTAGRQNGEKK
ncbi:MAG: D-alanine--D-alanine ligase, partial [candidate division Zixibacteria bacterium]|nr:D-alanine--D-alanine ligase [candidate division Zixibacteria bacterium]